MSFEWDEIQSKWLYDLPISYSKKEIVEAFNKVERKFGPELFDKYAWIRGNYIVTLIVDLARILEETKKGKCRLPQNGEIVQKIKRNDLYSTSTLIRLAACYLRHGLLVEFEPEILVDQRQRKPDLRVRFDKKWIYIEESKLETSLHQKQLSSILERISNVAETVHSNLNIEVLLLKDEFSYEEVSNLIGKIKALSNIPEQPQELKMEGLAQIFTYEKGQEKPVIEEKRPALGESTVVVGGGFERHLNVQIPFTDVRIEKILKKGKQLSPIEHNMIILDISIPGTLKHWSESAREILRADQHHKIGAVLLVRKGLFVRSLKVNSNLIAHPNPLKILPRDFVRLTTNHFKQSSEYHYVRPSKEKS